jgi:hypothetical protein
MLARLRGNPRPFVLICVGLVILGGFLAVVAPLFNTGGAPSAQVAGAFPEHATAGKPFEVDIALDNQGDSVLQRSCIEADVSKTVTPDYAIFQGVDTQRFNGNTVCGGALTGQETISIRMFLTASAPGVVQISLLPVEGSQVLGSGLSGQMRVASP